MSCNGTNVPLHIQQGDTFKLAVVYENPADTPVNLTGYSARMQLRPTIGSSTAFVSLTSALNGGLVITGASGRIDVAITDEQTLLITEPGVYALKIEAPNGEVTTLLSGPYTLSKQVTT